MASYSLEKPMSPSECSVATCCGNRATGMGPITPTIKTRSLSHFDTSFMLTHILFQHTSIRLSNFKLGHSLMKCYSPSVVTHRLKKNDSDNLLLIADGQNRIPLKTSLDITELSLIASVLPLFFGNYLIKFVLDLDQYPRFFGGL